MAEAAEIYDEIVLKGRGNRKDIYQNVMKIIEKKRVREQEVPVKYRKCKACYKCFCCIPIALWENDCTRWVLKAAAFVFAMVLFTGYVIVYCFRPLQQQ